VLFRSCLHLEAVRPDETIRAAWRRWREQAPLGGQYEWLAAYARQTGIRGLELSVERGDASHAYAILKNICEPWRHPQTGANWRVPAQAAEDFPHLLFRDFHFPLLGLTKPEMETLAKTAGFLDILDRAWFCHSPVNGEPCGRCQPCQCAIQEGMARRLPAAAIRRFRRRQFRHRIKRQIQGLGRGLGALFTGSSHP
jgi:hypothetical protein